MKIIACYDNGGKTFDRYTIVFDAPVGNGEYESLGVGWYVDNYSQFGYCTIGKHLGNIISFKKLPEHVQEHILRRIAE